MNKDLRNAEKRRQRLKKRAKQLSDADLLAVMALRTHERALGRNAAGGDDNAGVDPDESEAGSVASASTRGISNTSASPILQPKKKRRSF